MLDFLPPDGMTLEEASTVLVEHLDVALRGGGETDRTFYDTFDGLLHAAGKSCVYEAGRLKLVDVVTGMELDEAVVPAPTLPLRAGDLEDGRLRQRLRKLIDVRALLPLAHVHARAYGMSLLDDLEKTVARIRLEEPMLIGDGAGDRPLRPRLSVAGVRGYDEELRTLSQELEGTLGFRPADQPLVDEAARAAGRPPAGVSSKVEVPLARGEPADRAAAKVLARLLEVIELNLDGTIADIDSEFLHDLRVAVRRTRSVQREFKRAFPAEALERFRQEFRWLQQVTGPARDLDVYVLEFDRFRALVPETMRSHLDPLLGVLRERRLDARSAMAKALRSTRCTGLVCGWREFLDDGPHAAGPVEAVAAERILKVYERMVKMGRAIERTSPAAEYHELRKKGKELRYLLELFGLALFEPDVVKPMIKALKSLQDVLGRHQDREVQIAMLWSLRDEVAARPDGPAALMAVGGLVQSLQQDERAAREEFTAQFDAFAAKAQRTAVKETFS
jgi:CHAD domain-containing protein